MGYISSDIDANEMSGGGHGYLNEIEEAKSDNSAQNNRRSRHRKSTSIPRVSKP